MTQSNDRRIHADALRRHHRLSQWQRFKRQAGIMLASVALGSIGAPYAMLDKGERWAIGVYVYARGALWIAFSSDPAINVTHEGRQYRVPARAVVADRYYHGSVSRLLSLSVKGGLLGFMGWLSGLFLLRGIRAGRRERALRDHVIAGTLVTGEKQLAALTAAEAGVRALAIGAVPIPARLETRHMAMIGTTGSGKTTALRQMLDGIEARGEAALVYDTSGEFIAHYYDPARGDIILNPFDARCAFWSPFVEITHPADADRIAQQLIPETGQHDRDVWLETSRILVANMIRELWKEKKCTLPDLLDALQKWDKDKLKSWLKDTSSARTFSDVSAVSANGTDLRL